MNQTGEWRQVWEERSAKATSDYEFDRGTSPRHREIEELSKRELREFIDPQPREVIFDAGCGTGVNIFLLHSTAGKVIGMDCTTGALARCQRRIESDGIDNVELIHGDVTKLAAGDVSVDKVLCMSVFQYLNDAEVQTALNEFARILKSGGTIILHVKNISSLYLSTLWVAKKIKILLGRPTKLEYFRSFRWYKGVLRSAGFDLLEYNSFNIFMIESMPRKWLLFFQKLELKYHKRFPLSLGFMRRRGSELKLKARVTRRESMINPVHGSP